VSPEFDSFTRNKDFPHLLAGDQKWKGAALTLNKNPILNTSKDKFK
jgi:hypothetical protein